MNKYFSSNRTATAYLWDMAVANAGVDGGIATLISTGQAMLFNFPYDKISRESIIHVNSVGLFCNLADGLVLDTYQSITISIGNGLAGALDGSGTLSNDVTTLAGNESLLGAGIDVGIQVGDIVGVNGWYSRVEATAPNEIMFKSVLRTTGVVPQSYTRVFRPDSSSYDALTTYDLPTLNTMYEIDWNAQAAAYAQIPALKPTYNYISAVYGSVITPVQFRVDTIKSSLADVRANMSLVVNCEITEA